MDNKLALKAWIKKRRSILKQIYNSSTGLDFSSFYCLCVKMYEDEIVLSRSDKITISENINLITKLRHEMFLNRSKLKKETILPLREKLFLKIVDNRVKVFNTKNKINTILSKYT